MVHEGLRKDLNHVLHMIAEKLDIGPERHGKASKEYEGIANWLNQEETSLAPYSPQIYPQGSFALGTAVKPINPDEDFDIDLVCELSSISLEAPPTAVKRIVGDRLKESATYRKILKEKNRCWRLDYPGDFHIDILPAKPDEHRGGTAILIPDKELSDWSQSDPKGYALWFRERMLAQFNLNRIALATRLNKEIEEVPDHEIKTTLQKAIQLLKRHRDIQFIDDPDNKPISIIITTLAGHSYRNQEDLLETIISLANEMPNHIRQVGSEFWVTNPVNLDENFADKWQNHPERRKAFYDWIEILQKQLSLLEVASSLQETETILKQLFGEGVSQVALKEITSTQTSPIVVEGGSQLDVSHKHSMKWEYHPKYEVQVTAIKSAGKTIKGVMAKAYPNNGKQISKLFSLEFTATTNTPHPYSVEWQVTNTGEEARNANGLRGGYEYSSGTKNNKFIRKENTQYNGTHFVEAFVIKDGISVARSGDFIVNIQ
jgi:hypothetical protein